MIRGLAGCVWVLAAGALLIAAPASAQIGTPMERDRDCVCVDELRDRVVRSVRAATGHAAIGVVLGEREEVAGRQGIRAARVPEGGAAHRAGLRGGDVIVAVNGRHLGADPGAGLVDRLSEVTPGDTVDIAYVRDGEERNVPVVTRERELLRALGGDVRLQIPAARRARALALEAEDAARLRGPGTDVLFRHARPHGLELAVVNPELGEYFGTDRGVLVTAVPGESSLNLRPGDVILEIGDRDVRDPAHFRSILASYRDDESITLRIVRNRRTLEVTGSR